MCFLFSFAVVHFVFGDMSLSEFIVQAVPHSQHCAVAFLNFNEHPMASDLNVPHYHFNINRMTGSDIQKAAMVLHGNQLCLPTFLDLHGQNETNEVAASQLPHRVSIRTEDRRVRQT